MILRVAVLVMALAMASRPVVGQTPADSALAQIERRATAGDRVSARSLADSLLAVLPRASDQYAEALYWRAFTAPSAAEAERDYLRVGVEYPLSRRAPAALLTLAQLEYARGDRRGARGHFERLLLDHPSGAHVAKAAYWSGRLALDDGDVDQGCASLTLARRSVTPDDVELMNQIEYYVARCTATDSTSASGVDSTATEPLRREFSIQAGAFDARGDAAALAARLRSRGFDARVAGTRAPYRVRIGRYASREEAAGALARVRRTSPRAIIVEAEPR
jgi:hypothetical protein